MKEEDGAVSAVEEVVGNAVDLLIPVVEAIGALIVFVGALLTFVLWLLSQLGIRPIPYERVRLTLGRYLALGLEFQLGADILSTAVSPTFQEIAKLGAIATIRTALNFFLSRELNEEARRADEDQANDRRGSTGEPVRPAP